MKLRRILLVALAVLMCTCTAYGHSGRTDSSGGHRDNKNVSGLGSYHYHCGGHPAHLHPNGVCPYSSSYSGSSSSVSSAPKVTAPDPNRNNVYLLHTMPQMTVGESFTAEAVSNNSSAALVWSSSNSNVASVDNAGRVTARGVGSAVITVSNGYKSASYNVTCKGYISYTSTEAKINGKPIQLYYYNSDYYVLCSDLTNYGFDTVFTKGTDSSLVKVTRNSGKAVSGKDVVAYPNGKIAYVVAPTSINVLCGSNTNYSKAVNGDGRMFVAFDSLSTFGKVTKTGSSVELDMN